KAIVPQVFPERAFPVSYAKKDLEYAVDLATSVGVDATGARNLVACFEAAIEQGHADKYAPAISLVFENTSRQRVRAGRVSQAVSRTRPRPGHRHVPWHNREPLFNTSRDMTQE